MKKITLYKIILIILIIVAILLSILVIKKHIESNKVESETQEVLLKIKNTQEIAEVQTDVIQEIKEEIGGYKVIGIIKIPKINIEYPILEKTDTKSLNLSITKFWGGKINQVGNIALAGHNNLNDRMFGKINKLKEGDIIELTDDQMVTVKYEVFKIYVVDPNDITCILAEDETKREVTLITCIDRAKNRLIVKAREIY